MAYNTKLRLINAKMEQPSGSTLTLSGNTVFNVGSDGIPKYSQHPDFTGSTVYNDPQVLVDKEYVDGKVTGEFDEMRFTSDILVSIEEGKTFGRYENGQLIPASGKTPSEVILMAVQEPINPEVSITFNSSGSDVRFGQGNKVINLNIEYEIKSLGAESTTAVLEWRRGTSGSWTELTDANIDVGVTGFTGTYTHTIDDSGDRFDTTVAEYRLVVTDSQAATNLDDIDFPGGTAEGGSNGGFRKTMQGYQAPSINRTVIAQTIDTNFETQGGNSSGRAKGNVNSDISGSASSNRDLVAITDWFIERSVNNTSSWVTVASGTGLDVQSVSIPSTPDTGAASDANTIYYRIRIVDEFDGGNSSNFTITLRFPSYWGYSTQTSLTAAEVTALGNPSSVGSNTSATRNLGNVNVPTGNYLYYAYPSNLAEITTVIQDGNTSFPVAQVFESPTLVNNVETIYDEGREYRVYRTIATRAFEDSVVEMRV